MILIENIPLDYLPKTDLEEANDEIERLRSLLHMKGRMDHTHQCRKCLLSYSPGDSPDEDCPACGYDGK